MIYLDNAATTYPKPTEVINAVNRSFSLYGANPGRSGHNLSINTAMEIYSAREKLNELFDGYGSELVSFTMNCTYALNMAIKGVLKKGDHVIMSSLEHNSVLRPIFKMAAEGIISSSVFAVTHDINETICNLKKEIRENTRLIIVTAVSNAFGDILPLEEISNVARENNILFFVDGAQGAGVIPLKMKKTGINCLCVPGHKGLLGVMGVGALLHDGCIENTIIEGGTGSESFNYLQPKSFPEKLEGGTLNVPAICGLKKGVEIVSAYGVENIFKEETYLMKLMFNELASMRRVVLYRSDYNEKIKAPLIAFNIKGYHSEEVASYLNDNSVAVRGGYHCSPLAHKTYGTDDIGAVRISPSRFTTKKDVNYVINLLQKFAKNKKV